MVTPRGYRDEGRGFQRHHRGPRVLQQLAALGAAVTVSAWPPRWGPRSRAKGPASPSLRSADPGGDDRPAAGRCLCVDATHPYAVEATRNIRAAVPWPGRSTTACCGPKARCPPGAWCLPTAAQAPHFWPDAGKCPAGHRGQGACRLCGAGPGTAVTPGCCPRGRALPPARPPVSRTRISLPCRGRFSYALNCAADEAVLHPVSSLRRTAARRAALPKRHRPLRTPAHS